MPTIKRSYLLIGAILMVAACTLLSSVIPTWLHKGEQFDASAAPQLIAANNAFALELYRTVTGEDKGENVMIAPTGICTVLALVLNGAAGETRTAIAGTLGWESMSVAEINQASGHIMSTLTDQGSHAQLSIANGIWVDEGVLLRSEFRTVADRFYKAEVAELDFGDPGAVDSVNAWVRSKTNRRIGKFLDYVRTDTVILLANATYFKGKWRQRFDKSMTRPGEFRLPGGDTVTVPMMHRWGTYEYYQGERFQAIKLPYQGTALCAYIFLPEDMRALKEFRSRLTAGNWSAWMSGFRSTECEVALPRFTVRCEIELASPLEKLGMAAAFYPDANFSAMSAEPQLWIDRFKHAAFVQVDEEGSEAAAATEVELTPAAPPPLFFEVDRPFFMAIVDDKTGAILFFGSILHPDQE